MSSFSHSMLTCGCRVFQAVVKVGNYFLGYRMPEHITGPNSIAKLPSLLKEKGINDVLFVTGAGMVRRGQPQPMLDAMEKEGIRCTVLTFDHPDPTDEDVELGYKTYMENGCKSIIAMGGGSRMDCAKGIAAKIAHPNKRAVQFQGLLKVHKKVVPFVAIPTTAGTGSETTKTSSTFAAS